MKGRIKGQGALLSGIVLYFAAGGIFVTCASGSVFPMLLLLLGLYAIFAFAAALNNR